MLVAILTPEAIAVPFALKAALDLRVCNQIVLVRV